MQNNILEPFHYIYNDKKYENFKEFVCENNNLELDYASIYSLFCKGFIVGANTTISGLKREEWGSSVNLNLDAYNSVYKDSITISKDLITLLSEEILSSIEGKDSLYILLSGGMDSRVLAALVNNLYTEGKLDGKTVNAITWGLKDSRDVQYAKLICEKYDWEWHHLDLNVEHLKENLNVAINLNGAEVSPIHLHRYLEAGVIANVNNSIILAASYGDSLGRGEYSGTKLKNLKEMVIEDKFSLFNNEIENQLKIENRNRINAFREEYNLLQNNAIELEYQKHYMHKMLYNASAIINYNSEIFQLFSTKKVIDYILSLRFSCRNDTVYFEMLRALDPDLLKLSWARTGVQYLSNETQKQADNLKKNHHSYSTWIKLNFSSEIEEALNSEVIKELKLFDIKQLKRMFFLWKKEKSTKMTYLTDKFIYILTLKIFIETHNLKNDSNYQLENYGFNINKMKGLSIQSMITVKSHLK